MLHSALCNFLIEDEIGTAECRLGAVYAAKLVRLFAPVIKTLNVIMRRTLVTISAVSSFLAARYW